MNKKRLKVQENNFFKPVVIAIAALILGSFGIDYYFNSFIISDNAVVEGKLLSVYSKIPGQILHIYADENLEVKKGDIILELDPSFYEYSLRQAEDHLRDLKLKLKSEGDSEDSEKRSYFSKLKFPHNGFFKDYSKMYDEGINSEEDVENSKKCLTTPTSEHQMMSDKKKTQEVQKHEPSEEDAKKEVSPEDLRTQIKKVEAYVEQGKLNLSYTKVHVPQDGTVSVITVREGEYIYAGQNLISIIPKHVWVNASFVETKGKTIEVGQPVVVKLKNYPSRRFKGVVDSIQRSENPNEKVMVKIMFTEDYSDFNITPGLRVKAIVKVR